MWASSPTRLRLWHPRHSPSQRRLPDKWSGHGWPEAWGLTAVNFAAWRPGIFGALWHHNDPRKPLTNACFSYRHKGYESQESMTTCLGGGLTRRHTLVKRLLSRGL